MAAMIGTRDDDDLKKMLDARSVYGLSLRRDYFRPKSEIDSPTGNIFSLLPPVLCMLSLLSCLMFIVYVLELYLPFIISSFHLITTSFSLPNSIPCIVLSVCVRSTNAALGADITALDIRPFPWILLRLEGRALHISPFCDVL